jgi:hypothetical protein
VIAVLSAAFVSTLKFECTACFTNYSHNFKGLLLSEIFLVTGGERKGLQNWPSSGLIKVLTCYIFQGTEEDLKNCIQYSYCPDWGSNRAPPKYDRSVIA